MPATQLPENGYVPRVGDLVEVRSVEEILATLDEHGEYEGLPFMPEMVKYCNQRLVVYKVANKVCNTVTVGGGLRRMRDAVHLTGVRCDGSGHGGCQAACLIHWKTTWLRYIGTSTGESVSPPPTSSSAPELLATASRRGVDDDGNELYRCQATEMLRAAPDELRVRDVGQFVDDVRTGNVGIWWSLRALLVSLFNRFQDVSMRALPKALQFRKARRWGAVAPGMAGPTPTVLADLQPGEVVRVRSRKEIESSLDANWRNRGLGFDAEMTRFCGRTATVARRVEKVIDEGTGRMLQMKNPCIVLEGVVCEGAYSMNCPRAITSYWREIWLERVEDRSTPMQPREGRHATT